MRIFRTWIIADPHPQADELARKLRISPLVAQILLSRGVSVPDECARFLSPTLKDLHEPSLIANLPQAADRIARAIRDREKITIYGDYDVDGITATAILWHTIRLLGGEADYYIPHRIEEGYGLNSEAISQICDNGSKLIITVDCGVTAIEPAKVARDRGVDLIITDHHEWKADNADGEAGQPKIRNPQSAILPDCHSIVHPRMNDYPNPHLCGAGVAFKLAWGVGLAMSGATRVSEDFRAFLMDATALAALGTIADVVPLVGENRVIAHHGLGTLKSSKLHGMQALIASADLQGEKLDSYHVGFLLAPRLNACGRMGHARLAVEMLTHADQSKATEIAGYLEQQNRARQALERKILDEAITQVRALEFDTEGYRAIVLGAEGWHPGVIGIVASRIVDRFHKPTIMVALNNGTGQGSGRSVSGFHLARALEHCSQHLEAHGGHEMAAGLKLSSGKFEDFRRAFCKFANDTIDPALLVPRLHLDAPAQLGQITESLVHDFKRLGPFGHANRKPLLCCRDLTLSGDARRVGKTGDHLQLFLTQGSQRMKAIYFGSGELFDKLKQGAKIHLAAEPQINEYNGRVSVELMVKDLQFA